MNYAYLLLLLPVAAAVCAVWLWRRRRSLPRDLLTEMVGATVTVDAPISEPNGGSIVFRDTGWAARAVSPEMTFETGDRVTVVAVEGVKVICR